MGMKNQNLGRTPKFIFFLKFYKLGPFYIRLPLTKYCSIINNICLKENKNSHLLRPLPYCPINFKVDNRFLDVPK